MSPPDPDVVPLPSPPPRGRRLGRPRHGGPSPEDLRRLPPVAAAFKDFLISEGAARIAQMETGAEPPLPRPGRLAIAGTAVTVGMASANAGPQAAAKRLT